MIAILGMATAASIKTIATATINSISENPALASRCLIVSLRLRTVCRTAADIWAFFARGLPRTLPGAVGKAGQRVQPSVRMNRCRRDRQHRVVAIVLNGAHSRLLQKGGKIVGRP